MLRSGPAPDNRRSRIEARATHVLQNSFYSPRCQSRGIDPYRAVTCLRARFARPHRQGYQGGGERLHNITPDWFLARHKDLPLTGLPINGGDGTMAGSMRATS